MGASRLVKEDDNWMYLYMYVRNDVDEYPEWYDEDKHSDALLQWTEGVAYELRIDYRVNKKTYEVEIFSIK